MVIEAGRNLAGLTGASSAEFDSTTDHPIVATMQSQLGIVDGQGDLGGTMRLGEYVAELAEGSLVREVYGQAEVTERHRHRYEVNNSYRAQLESVGMKLSGLSPDSQLVEFVELDRAVHPFYIGTQAHPEFKSRPTRAHPLFAGLVAAAITAQGRIPAVLVGE